MYLNHYNIRQIPAQYYWVMCEVLGKNLSTHFILTEEYLKKYNTKDRWEIRWTEDQWGSFEGIIKRLSPNNYTVMKKPELLMKNIKDFTPSEILKYVVNNSFQEQIEAIEKVLKSKDIKAGITWVNNCCFKEVLRKHGIPTIHHELGPFRSPVYQNTVYLDFKGVNGNTEFDERFKEFLKIKDKVPILSREEIIKVIAPKDAPYLKSILRHKSFEYEIGVGLQVEVDTNLLLFNNGRSWIDPILQAQADSSKKILVRPHPGSIYNLKPRKFMVIDDPLKGNVQEFIKKCRSIYCMNSSVGLEAMLLGRNAKIFGDSPFKSICDMDEDTKLLALNFTIFSYLIHRNFLFNDGYYKFRLSCIGDEKAIYLGNMKRFLNEIKSTM